MGEGSDDEVSIPDRMADNTGVADTPRAEPDSGEKGENVGEESKPTLDADLEPSTVKDKAQDERLQILIDPEERVAGTKK